MKRYLFIIIGLIFSCHGCAGDNPGNDIYVMEELEAASSVEDPERRLERLRMFLESYPGHYCRKFAYRRIFRTLAVELGREEKAFNFINRVEEKENDTEVLSDLYYSGFSYLMDVDSARAVRYAENILREKDISFRKTLYFGFDLNHAGISDMAASMYRKGLGKAENSTERDFAGMILGEALNRSGREDSALAVLMNSAGNPFSGRYIGEILWKRGRRKEALQYYIALAAGVPRMRERVKLDSLYALVYPEEAGDLDGKILRERIGERKLLHDGEFMGIHGRTYALSSFRGRKLVIGAWSPD